MGEPRCSSSAIPRNLEQADLGRSTPPLATLVYTETKMSTHKHSEAGNELRSLSMIRYDESMNATTQRSKDGHFWHLTPLPAHRQVHTSHTPTSGLDYHLWALALELRTRYRPRPMHTHTDLDVTSFYCMRKLGKTMPALGAQPSTVTRRCATWYRSAC